MNRLRAQWRWPDFCLAFVICAAIGLGVSWSIFDAGVDVGGLGLGLGLGLAGGVSAGLWGDPIWSFISALFAHN